MTLKDDKVVIIPISIAMFHATHIEFEYLIGHFGKHLKF